MKKSNRIYVAPQTELVYFEPEDILTLSNNGFYGEEDEFVLG